MLRGRYWKHPELNPHEALPPGDARPNDTWLAPEVGGEMGMSPGQEGLEGAAMCHYNKLQGQASCVGSCWSQTVSQPKRRLCEAPYRGSPTPAGEVGGPGPLPSQLPITQHL